MLRAILLMLICPIVALAGPPLTAGAPAHPVRDTDICPTQAEAYDIAHLRTSDPMGAAKIATAAHCSLALADDTLKSTGGTQSVYRVITILPDQSGLLFLSEDTSEAHLTGFAVASDFEAAPETATSLAKKGIDWVQSAEMPIGCPSPQNWRDIMADPMRKYQTPTTMEEFITSHGCKTIISSPGTVWQLIKKSDDGAFVQLHSIQIPDDLYFRADAFSPLN